MKNFFTICFLTYLLVTSLFAEAGKLPWREGEKQVRITFSSNLKSPAAVQGIIESGNSAGYNISYEGGNGFIRCYVTNDEYNFLINKGLTIETEIDDLNAFSQSFGERGVPNGYYTVAELNEIADSLAGNFPTICTKTQLGNGSNGDPIYVLKISDNVNEDENEPELFFDGGIHGDEIGGPENMIRFARDLCLNYGIDSTFTNAVDFAETWIMYCTNPYGRNYMTRYNAYGVDVNRDCGYMWDGEGNSSGAFSQVESKIIRDMLRNHQTAMYLSYHSGTEFISYPWSYREDLTPDEANHNYLAQQYALNSGYVGIPYAPGYTGMYPINGSTKDYGYGATGSIAWSVEISMSKQPAASQVVPYYLKNKYAMLSMITHCINQGISGTVTDYITGEPLDAVIYINDLFPVNSGSVGDFHKFLVPGTYNLRIQANGYLPQEFQNVTISEGFQTVIDAALIKGGGYYAQNLVTCNIPNNNSSDEGNTPAATGVPDNTRYSIGRYGYVVVDLGTPALNRTGNDIKIFENDQTPEGYSVFASNTPDGPWLSLGDGTANTGFDLSSSMLTHAQFIKITDDGNGSSQVPDAGFDLDAVENLHPDTLTVGWVNGIVYNDQEPYFIIPDATIVLNGNVCTGNSNGFFSIAALPGEYEITATAPYFEGTDTIVVTLGDTLMHDLYLSLTESVKNKDLSSSFSVFPLPAIDVINIAGPDGEYLFELYDMNYRKLIIRKITLSQQGSIIETNTLKSGFYIGRISNDAGSGMLKIIIQ